jgi:hypothetical protein
MDTYVHVVYRHLGAYLDAKYLFIALFSQKLDPWMSRKKISTTIYVTPEQNDRLKLLHERTKVPVAVYIREGIDLVLKQYAHLLPGQLPLEHSLDFEARRIIVAAPATAPHTESASATHMQKK